ncbi:IS66 family insertion sequence element accessory protein TnpB [Sorangium sp. So ce341]|uniref:IS66 family insertion sequence element accessory protein TnpB n=1 Tax=Sorangium sp. So ce341 TaxID=3133302 RepID=UPI003F61EB48
MTPATIAVYLAVGPVDLRGAFDRLAAITRQVLCLDPASGALFLFLNKRRNRLKALWWDRNGYTILYKRLSKGAFALPSFTEADGCRHRISRSCSLVYPWKSWQVAAG